jgi:hypothetical protein
MYNPFPLLNERLLTDKIKEGKKYFVRQFYARGMQPRLKAAFLFRAYEETEMELAEQHLKTLVHDKTAFLYDVKDEEHLHKLHTAAKQPFGYKIYYAGKKGVDWKAPREYQFMVKNYIKANHPGWKTEKGGDKIMIGLYEEFGALFLKFSFEGEEDIIPLDEVEKY